MSNKSDVLVLSPTNIKFQSPFPHVQKRKLNLLNVSGEVVSYCFESSDEALCQVLPAKGCVSAFDTIELTILLQPSKGDEDSCMLTIKHKVQSEETQLSAADAAVDWTGAHTKQLKISLENCLENAELMRMFGFDGKDAGVVKTLEQKCQPICAGCCSIKLPKAGKRTWLQLVSWSAVGVALSILVLAYVVWISQGKDGTQIA